VHVSVRVELNAMFLVPNTGHRGAVDDEGIRKNGLLLWRGIERQSNEG
jgi:hypothetical protein